MSNRIKSSSSPANRRGLFDWTLLVLLLITGASQLTLFATGGFSLLGFVAALILIGAAILIGMSLIAPTDTGLASRIIIAIDWLMYRCGFPKKIDPTAARELIGGEHNAVLLDLFVLRDGRAVATMLYLREDETPQGADPLSTPSWL